MNDLQETISEKQAVLYAMEHRDRNYCIEDVYRDGWEDAVRWFLSYLGTTIGLPNVDAGKAPDLGDVGAGDP